MLLTMLNIVAHARSAVAAVPGAVRDPAKQTDWLQILKAAVAAVAAWVLSVQVLDLTQSFLAPWAALLTVHATVYRSLSRGAQAVAATGLGVVLSFAVAHLLGVGAVALGIALLASLLLARAGVLRDEGITIATTALFVLTSSYESQHVVFLDRVLDTAIGVTIGILVNLVVLPPINDHSAAQQIDRIDERLGKLMQQMASEMRSAWSEEHSADWIDHTRAMDHELDHGWQLVRHAKESRRWNPRRRLPHRAGSLATYSDVLHRLEDGIAQLRSMARTIHESTQSAQQWDPRFREPWLDLLTEVGQRVTDRHADVHAMREQVDNLTRELSTDNLPGVLWPLYGALISNLLNVIDVVDDVATAQPVRT